MNILFIISIIVAIFGLVGQWLDGFTTYQGVKKFGPSIEGDKSWFAQFLVKHPSTLLYLKPLLLGVIDIGLFYIGPQTDGGGYFLALTVGAVAGVMGIGDAINNSKINSKST